MFDNCGHTHKIKARDCCRCLFHVILLLLPFKGVQYNKNHGREGKMKKHQANEPEFDDVSPAAFYLLLGGGTVLSSTSLFNGDSTEYLKASSRVSPFFIDSCHSMLFDSFILGLGWTP